MILQALERFDRKTANGVIAHAALAIASGDYGAQHDEALDADVIKLVNEIKGNLNIEANDFSTKANAKLSDYLSSLLEHSVLADVDARTILSPLAQAGKLPPGSYKTTFTSDFQVFERLGTDKRIVNEAVSRPDDHQHLLQNDPLDAEIDALSLFMKMVPSRGKLAPYWLLVQTVRKGFVQVVQAAWRVYADDVQLTDAKQPLDVLRAFAEVFGAPVTIGVTTSKFIESHTFPKDPAVKEMEYRVHYPLLEESFGSSSHRARKDPSIFEVGVAYCIDIKLYRQALVRQGVSVRPAKPSR